MTEEREDEETGAEEQTEEPSANEEQRQEKPPRNRKPERKPAGKKRPSRKRQYRIALDMAQDHLEEWLTAEMEITTHQSYRLRDQTLTMADLDAVRRSIEYWSGVVEALKARQNGGPRNRVFRAVPKDD